MTFRGFPAAAITFFEQLEADNTRTFWHANKSTYDTAVKEPFDALAEALADEYGVFKLFRPFRDARFSKDKTPYKTQAGSSGETEGGAALYVQISAKGLFVGTGHYMLATDQLTRMREAIAAAHTGAELETLVSNLKAAGYDIHSDPLKTAPRGYAKDHPRIELLRYKRLTVGKDFGTPKWLHTTKAVDQIRAVFVAAEPLNAWLDAHVGPSTLPPPDWGRD